MANNDDADPRGMPRPKQPPIKISSKPTKDDLKGRPSTQKPTPNTVQDGRRKHGEAKNPGMSPLDAVKKKVEDRSKQKALDKASGKKGK